MPVPLQGYFPQVIGITAPECGHFNLTEPDGVERWLKACAQKIGDRGEFVISAEDERKCFSLSREAST